MEILYAAAEMVPYAKVGGLADVAGALTRELGRRGHRVAAVLPLYPSARRALERLEPERVAEIRVARGARRGGANLWRVPQPESATTLFLIESDPYFDRPNPYVDPATGRDWPDTAERFTFFSRAILEACRALAWAPDVIHLNDYQVGLVAPLLRAEHNGGPLARSATLYSVHNLGYQGIFPGPGEEAQTGELARRLAFPAAWSEPLGTLEFFERLNFTKGALACADLITTVSPTYAREIQTPAQGFGLDGLLRERCDRVLGILNGIDVEAWNPATDPLIPHNYGPSDFQGKARNKARLLEAMHLPGDLDRPVIGIISRLVDQKGFDLVARIAEALLTERPVRLVVLGSGQPKYERFFRRLAHRHPAQVGVDVGFNEPLAHLIEAGSDFFLMPSRYEPCGLNQMYSMRYGTVPIVRATGGLADTVSEFNPETGRGSGFVFTDYTPQALRGAIDRALAAHGRTRSFKSLVTRLMQRDFSWRRAAERYEQAYERAVNYRAVARREGGGR